VKRYLLLLPILLVCSIQARLTTTEVIYTLVDTVEGLTHVVTDLVHASKSNRVKERWEEKLSSLEVALATINAEIDKHGLDRG